MTTFDIFIGALLALSVYELIHLAAKEAVLYVRRKKSKKRWDAMWAKLETIGLDNNDFDCDDDCEICNDECYDEPVKPVKKKAVAKKKTVKKAAPKRKTR